MLAAAVWAFGAMPLGAQSNGAVTAPPPTNSTEIGPGELSNFTLNGTVTRPADRPPATQPPPPAVRPEPAPPAESANDRPAPATSSPPAGPQPNPADSDLFRRPPTLPDATAANEVSAAPPVIAGGQPSAVPLPAEGFSLLPWIVALFAAAGAAVIYLGRQRRQQRYATGGPAIDITRREVPEPKPVPAAAPRDAPAPVATGGARRPLPTTLMPPPPTPVPAQPKPSARPPSDPVIPGGIVATSLRPWIDIELTPDRALLDEAGAAIAFEVTLFNSGSAAARDVIIEARLFNAGASQDAELSEFFTAADAPGDPIPQIAPYARIPLRSAVRLTRAEIREYEVEGRKLFMPLVAINIRYRWSSGKGQSAAGFLVGQGKPGQDKLAPLRLDRGARSWTGLGARRYEKGLRS